MRWIQALKIWNGKKGGAWCVPRKGSAEHAEVKRIMAEGKEEAVKKEVAEEMKAVPPKKFKPRVREEVKVAFEEKKKESKREKVKSFLKRALEKHRERKSKQEKELTEEEFYKLANLTPQSSIPHLVNAYLDGSMRWEKVKENPKATGYNFAKGAVTFLKTDIETRLTEQGVEYFNKHVDDFMKDETRMNQRAYKGFIENRNKFLQTLSLDAKNKIKEEEITKRVTAKQKAEEAVERLKAKMAAEKKKSEVEAPKNEVVYPEQKVEVKPIVDRRSLEYKLDNLKSKIKKIEKEIEELSDSDTLPLDVNIRWKVAQERNAKREPLEKEVRKLKKEATELRKQLKEAPIEYNLSPSKPNKDINPNNLFMMWRDLALGRGSTEREVVKSGVVYEYKNGKMMTAYSIFAGNKYPYQSPEIKSHMVRDVKESGEQTFETDVSKKGVTYQPISKGKDRPEDRLIPYKPSKSQLHWLKTGEYI